jgi:hypothetical protein
MCILFMIHGVELTMVRLISLAANDLRPVFRDAVDISIYLVMVTGTQVLRNGGRWRKYVYILPSPETGRVL